MVGFNVHLPVLLQVSRSEGGTLLPWPNGTLLSGRLMPPTEGAGAMLMLGNYRVRIEVPPNTPMGQAWLQLMQREMPGQFRLLTDKQAIALIADLLQKSNLKSEALNHVAGKDKPASQQAAQQGQAGGASGAQTGSQEWSKFQADTFPYGVETYAERLMLFDKRDGGTQGVLQKEEGQQGFMLHGRLDLEHMGATAFSLEGKEGSPWKINLHMANQSQKQHIEYLFSQWLQEKQSEQTTELEGHVFDSIPQSFGSSGEREG